jgi:ATP dependent DNA ligase domain
VAPSGPNWVHEVKHDGYRLIVRRDGDTVRLFTRRGYDWSERYPAIARAAKLRGRSFTIDLLGQISNGLAALPTMQRKAHECIVSHLPTFIYMDEHRSCTGHLASLAAVPIAAGRWCVVSSP